MRPDLYSETSQVNSSCLDASYEHARACSTQSTKRILPLSYFILQPERGYNFLKGGRFPLPIIASPKMPNRITVKAYSVVLGIFLSMPGYCSRKSPLEFSKNNRNNNRNNPLLSPIQNFSDVKPAMHTFAALPGRATYFVTH